MKRIEWIDFGKGITILCVMLVHVIEGMYKTGNYVQYNELSRILMGILFTFIMPVFFALSGYLYKSPKSKKEYLQSMKKKAVNLLIPYALFSVIYVVLQHFGDSVNTLNPWSSLIFIYARPIGYLWFLYVLFFIFLLVGCLDLIHIGKRDQFVIYIILFVISQLVEMPYVFAGTFTWTVCFYIGNLIKLSNKLFDKRMIVLLVLVICLGWGYQYCLGSDWYQTNVLRFKTVVTKVVSIPLAFYLFYNAKKNAFFKYFVKYGKYSLIIYLIHAPAASIVRTVFMHVGMTNYFALIVGTSIVTWYVSIIVCWMSERFIWVNRLFYPYKMISNLKK